MGLGNHYINVFTVLRTLGFLNHLPVKLATGQDVVPFKVVRLLLPTPKHWHPAPQARPASATSARDGRTANNREVLIYQVSDHHACYEEIESQGISYTAGVPPVAAAMLVAQGIWDPKTVVNVEELDPDPFIDVLNKIGLPTDVKEIKPGSKDSFNGTVRYLETELVHSTATVTVSAANPMIAFDAKAQAKNISNAAKALASASKTRKTTKPNAEAEIGKGKKTGKGKK